MAAPTPVSNLRQEGSSLVLTWSATWATTDNFSDTVVVDRSALTGSVQEIEVQKLIIQCSSGIDALVEFDHATDALIFKTQLGNTIPFVGEPPHGREGIRAPSTIARPFVAAGDGDILITTTSAASGDVVSLWMWARLHF